MKISNCEQKTLSFFMTTEIENEMGMGKQKENAFILFLSEEKGGNRDFLGLPLLISYSYWISQVGGIIMLC